MRLRHASLAVLAAVSLLACRDARVRTATRATAVSPPNTVPVPLTERFASAPALGMDSLRVADLNGDGWMDVQVRLSPAADGNERSAVYLYDSKHSAFVRDTVLGDGAILPRGGGCVLKWWSFGGGPSSETLYCWRGGRWRLQWVSDGAFRRPAEIDTLQNVWPLPEPLRGTDEADRGRAGYGSRDD